MVLSFYELYYHAKHLKKIETNADTTDLVKLRQTRRMEPIIGIIGVGFWAYAYYGSQTVGLSNLLALVFLGADAIMMTFQIRLEHTLTSDSSSK